MTTEGRAPGTARVNSTHHFFAAEAAPTNLPVSGEILWRHSMTTRPGAAALTTGGGLVVGSDSDRNLYIHDVANGDVLFRTRLPASVQGFPITYAVGGRQYLAAPVGGNRSNAIYVFALSPISKITRESTLDVTWNAIRAGKFALITPVITSTLGFWVARTK